MSKPQVYIASTPEETIRVAEAFAETLKGGDVVALNGNLGAGKTFFTQAICKYLQADPPATSPTFTIINIYYRPDGSEVYHCDAYRLEHGAELANLGLDDYMYGDGICLIEWADRIKDFLPASHYRVDLEQLEGETEGRRISIGRIG